MAEISERQQEDPSATTCADCERCRWQPDVDCGLTDHAHCPTCGHCMGRHGLEVAETLHTPFSWPEGTEPTDEQVAEWLGRATYEERLERVSWWRQQAGQGWNCFIRNHEGELTLRDDVIRSLQGRVDQLSADLRFCYEQRADHSEP